MISSIEEVQRGRLLQAEYEEKMIFKRPYLMTDIINPKQYQKLIRSLKFNLPGSYLELIGRYNINGIEIDGFEFSPYFSKGDDIVKELSKAQEDPFFPKEFMEKHHMYQIGSWNTDLICITCGTDQFIEGEILFVDEGYDIYNPEDSQIHRIAKNFEDFLIVAANLEDIHTQMNDDEYTFEEQKQEFLRRLQALNVSEDYHATWLMFL